jgi:hypothetical protein
VSVMFYFIISFYLTLITLFPITTVTLHIVWWWWSRDMSGAVLCCAVLCCAVLSPCQLGTAIYQSSSCMGVLLLWSVHDSYRLCGSLWWVGRSVGRLVGRSVGL